MKNLKNYISLILGIVISFSTLVAVPAFAQETAPATNAPEDVVADITNKGTCYKGLDGSILNAMATGQMITTEIEEGFAGDGDYGGAKVKNCFRVTACKAGDDNKTMCVSFLNEKCEISSEQVTLTKKTNKDLELATDQNNLSCEKVQLIISKAGTGLLYAYIGMVYKWAASIVGVIAVLIIVVSGIQISAAGGDPAKVDEAKGRIIRALAGLAVLFMSGLILYTINPTFFVV